MLNTQQSQQIMDKFIELREIAKKTSSKEDIKALKDHERICIESFKYIVYMRTSRYKTFSNYNDLNQEGLEALVKAMNNYDPTKGNVFFWFHRYIDTRIARCANLHTTIRYPLKIAKSIAPHRENIMPLMINNRKPDDDFETVEIGLIIDSALNYLDNSSKQVIEMAFGLDGGKPMSINKICKKLDITRTNCIKIIDTALSVMKDNINI